VEGALAEVTWNVGGTETVVTCPLPSDNKGEITCSLANISGAFDQVTMTVTRVYGTNIDGTIAPQPQTVFTRPSGVSAP
jgi:hypothetical protein